MKRLFFIFLWGVCFLDTWAAEANQCVSPSPTVINQPIWIKPNRDTPNWYLLPTTSSPPRTSSSVPSRGG